MSPSLTDPALMEASMQRKRFYATQLMKLCFQALLYASLFASFFGMLSITNEAILNITRTAGTTMATFVLTMLLS